MNIPSTLNTLTALAIRVTGIILGLYALRTAGAYFYGASTNENAAAYFWLIMAPMLLLLAASVLMIALPHAIARKLIPKTLLGGRAGEDTQPVTLAGVEALAVSIVGLYFLIQSVLDATYIGTLWYATKQFAMPWAWSPTLVATVITALVEFIAAMWLLLGGKGVISLMRWARTAHPKR